MRVKRVKSLASDLAIPLAVGVSIVVLGAAIGRLANWGPGAYWGLAVFATAISFVLFARQDLARISKRNRG